MKPLIELLRAVPEASQLLDSLDNLEITGITSDSSKVKNGFVFVALKGEKTDGAKFIPQAIENGAVAVVRDSSSASGRLHSEGSVPNICLQNPRLALAKMAAVFYGRQPENIVAVTGTDGKTSTADFFRQLVFLNGEKSVSIGTIGVISGDGENLYAGTLTTPDSVELQRILAELSGDAVQYVALEASSHGLDQYRLDGVNLQAAAFVNIARDHLDYHKTEEAYFIAKSRLFSELLPEGKTAVLNQDDKRFAELKEICKKRNHKIIGFGKSGEEFTINNITPNQHGQNISLTLF
ncbi:MAG: Mur ligase family protein, partial [Rickettsiales bacterium]